MASANSADDDQGQLDADDHDFHGGDGVVEVRDRLLPEPADVILQRGDRCVDGVELCLARSIAGLTTGFPLDRTRVIVGLAYRACQSPIRRVAAAR